jgi:predicted ester cyclase
MELAKETYAPRFVDHVNATELHGHEGIRRSTALSCALFDHPEIHVVDQVSQGDRVASRWALTGVNRGRRAELSGITISRIDGGRIVEDWTALDSLELLRQLGFVRALLAAPRLLRATRPWARRRPRMSRDGRRVLTPAGVRALRLGEPTARCW